MQIIGLTGLNAAGKSTVAEILKEKGYEYFSLSDVVREYATQKGLDHSRNNLIICGNELREKFGPDILANKILEKIYSQNTTKAIVDSIRNIYEVKTLKSSKHFIMIGITAPVEIRFKRALKRGRIGFETSLEDFIKIEEKENSSDPQKQQLLKCLEMADFLIDNSSTLENLKNKVEEILIKVEHQ